MAGNENKAEVKKITELDFGVEKATDALDTINDKLKKIADESEKYAEKIGKNLGSTLDVGKYIDSNSTAKSMQEITDKVVKNDKVAQRQIVVNHQASLDKRLENQERHEQRIEEINARQLKSTKTLYDKVAEYAKTYLIYQAFNQLKQAAVDTVNEMVDVESQMIAIERVMEEGSIVVDDYRDKLIQLAYQYGNSFENVSDITLRLAQAGFDANEALALTEKTLLALNTAELNATQATSDMVAVMAQWGLMTGTAAEQADEYGSIIDKINIVADRYPTTSEDIMNALKKTSSAFKIAGADIDETIATIVAAETASQRGGKAIGTALSNISQQLKETSRIDVAKDLGISFYTDETETEYKDLMVILQELSDKMQQLKDEGKESSVEMQELLSVFTVFRRNIGASLLGEMAGEDSTYAEVLATLNESLGYSLKENEKYMKSAKAAQQQFNATLLELKTTVWDAGLEDVFRSMLLLGEDIVSVINTLVDTFGTIPSAIGVATLAFTAFNKKTQVVAYNMKTNKIETAGFIKELITQTKQIKKTTYAFREMKDGQMAIASVTNTTKQNITDSIKAGASYTTQLVATTAKTIGLQVATVALNTALSMGLSLGITAIISLLDNFIHAEEKAQEKMQEQINKINEEISAYETAKENIDGVLESYEKLSQVDTSSLSGEELEEHTESVYKMQLNVTSELRKHNEYTEEMIDNLDLQIQKLREINRQQAENAILKQQELVDSQKAVENLGDIGIEGAFDYAVKKYQQGWLDKKINPKGFDIDEVYQNVFGTPIEYGEMGMLSDSFSIEDMLREAGIEKSIEFLDQLKTKMKEAGDEGTDAFTEISNALESLREQEQKAIESQAELNEMIEQYDLEQFDIQNLEDYEEVLQMIANTPAVPEGYSDSLEIYKDQMTKLVKDAYPKFSEETQLAIESLKEFQEAYENNLEIMKNYEANFATLTTAINEFNNAGGLTVDTFNNLVNNNLLQYLEEVDGKLRINEAAFIDDANAAKQNAIAALQNEAATEIYNIAIKDLAKQQNNSTSAKNTFVKNANESGNAALDAAKKYIVGATTAQAFIDSMAGEGVNWSGLSEEATNQINNVISNLNRKISALNKISLTTAKATNTAAKSSSRASQEAAKAEEEAYKKRLKAFTDYVKEIERLEKRWVDKQRSLGVLTAEDEKYVIQQRIKRYEQYLQEVKEMTWLNAEDRLELEKEYTEEIQDLQLDYIELLEDQLDDQIDALKDANEKKIELIEEEADKRIEALKKVEDETDRIRAKEEYLRKRQEHLDDISYWEQRTGREAQEALLEARKKLEELDNEWQQQLEDWDIEDQIAAIEAERDAQIEAIKAAEEAEIASMQNIYDEKVKLFSETGQIIYDNSVIQSQALYEAYKKNFIDPIMSDLNNLNSTTNTAASSAGGQYESYTVQRGDTLSKIAKKYNTTVEKIMAANPSIKNKNKIYTGNTIQIPKFHNGGIVGGNQEGFALLKPQEVVLKPEWADGINRLAKMARNMDNPISASNTTIQVKGDLVRIDANIKNKTEAEYLTRKIEKMLKDKFNIKK